MAEGNRLVRVRVADGHIERVSTLEHMSLVSIQGLAHWIGLASDDSPITLRERSVAEVYALDVEWP